MIGDTMEEKVEKEYIGTKNFGDLDVKRVKLVSKDKTTLYGFEVWTNVDKEKMLCYFSESGMEELAVWINDQLASR